jgi:hypothetical protein
MSSILVLVSKAVFEKDSPPGLAVGGVWAVDRWNSRNPSLEPVAAGGSLFLVTVRPGERLWLVGVLDAPTFDGERWNAKANAVKVTDITDRIPKLVFATRKGLKVEPGKLGMSLQTPRLLADSDVALLAGGAAAQDDGAEETSSTGASSGVAKPVEPAKGKKSAKSIARPEPMADVAMSAPSPDALRESALASSRAAAEKLPGEVVAELAPLLSLSSAAKALAGAKALVKKVGEGAADIAIYDAVAAGILAGSAKTKTQAGDCHAAARAIERKLKLKVDLDDAVLRVRVLSAEGALWVKELSQLAKAVSLARRVDLAPGLADAAVATVAHGEVPTADLLERLGALGPEHAERALAGWLEGDRTTDPPSPGGLAKAEDDLWNAARPWLKGALERSPSALAWIVAFQGPNRNLANLGWLSALAAAGVAERVSARAPELAKQFAERILVTVGPSRIDATSLEAMRQLLEPLLGTVKARGERIGIGMPSEHAFRGGSPVQDPRVLELLFALDAPVDTEADGTLGIGLFGWSSDATDHPYRALTRLGAHATLRERIVRGLVDALENTQLADLAARIAETPSLHVAFDAFLEKVVGGLTESGTLGGFEALLDAVTRLCQPKVLEAFPQLRQAVQAIDAEQLLWRQLRAGLLDEWGWPALDEAFDRLGAGASFCGGCFPHGIVRKGDRLVVAGPDAIVLDVVDPILASDAFKWCRALCYVEGDVLLLGASYEGRWQDLGTISLGPLLDPLTAELPAAPLQSDGTRLRSGATPSTASGYSNQGVFCDGRELSSVQGSAVHRFDVATGKRLADGYPSLVTARWPTKEGMPNIPTSCRSRRARDGRPSARGTASAGCSPGARTRTARRSPSAPTGSVSRGRSAPAG